MKHIEKRILTKANLEDLIKIVNERFAKGNDKEEIRKNILEDIEIHFNTKK